MGTIIALNLRPERDRPAPPKPTPGGGDIVIFPGVRYERVSEIEARKGVSKGRRQRDVLLIPD